MELTQRIERNATGGSSIRKRGGIYCGLRGFGGIRTNSNAERERVFFSDCNEANYFQKIIVGTLPRYERLIIVENVRLAK